MSLSLKHEKMEIKNAINSMRQSHLHFAERMEKEVLRIEALEGHEDEQRFDIRQILMLMIEGLLVENITKQTVKRLLASFAEISE